MCYGQKVSRPYLATFVVCMIIFSKFMRLKFTCVYKCIWRNQNQSHNTLELISNCHELFEFVDIWAIRRPHKPPPTPRYIDMIMIVEMRTINSFWARCPIYVEHVYVFVSVLRFAPNYPPLEYRYLIRHITELDLVMSCAWNIDIILRSFL